MDPSTTSKDRKAECDDQKVDENKPSATSAPESNLEDGLDDEERDYMQEDATEEMRKSIEGVKESFRMLGLDEETGLTKATIWWGGCCQKFRAKFEECSDASKAKNGNILTVIKDTMKMIEDIPYKTKDMVEKVNKAKDSLDNVIQLESQVQRAPDALTEDGILEGLDARDRKVYHALKALKEEPELHHDYLKTHLVSQYKVMVSQYKVMVSQYKVMVSQYLRDTESFVKEYLHETHKATIACDHAITGLSGLSQAEGTNMFGTMNTATRDAVATESKDDREAKRAKTDHPMPAAANKDSAYSKVIKEYRKLDDAFLKIDENQQDHQDLLKKLLFVHNSVENYLEKASFLKDTEKDYKQRVKKDMDFLHDEVAARLREGKIDSPLAWSENDERVAPGPDAHEVDGAEVFLLVLFRLIGECLHPPYITVPTTNCLSSASPLKKETKNQNIFNNPKDGQPTRPERRCDIVLTKEGRHAIVIWDDAMQLGGEAKPGTRGSKTISDLLSEALDQALSHSAKAVAVGLNFAGVGVPSHATMFVINMGCIRVIQLTLESVGTPDAKVVFYKSELHPLLSKDQTLRWTNSSSQTSAGHRKAFKDFVQTLFPSDDGDQVTSDSLPSGIGVICALMQKRRKDLFGPTINAKNEKLGDVLGTGTFSTVFRCADAPTHCIKLSRYGRDRALANEARILESLGKNHSCTNVAALVKDGVNEGQSRLDVSFGDVRWQLPFISITPVGVPSSLSCRKNAENLGEWIGKVLSGLDAGLKFLHDKEIVHRDLNPSNIVIREVHRKDGDRDITDIIPVIIDFSIASMKSDPVWGFHGTVQYAHWKSFTLYPNKEEKWGNGNGPEVVDYAGLAFTMATFVNGGSKPWNSVSKPWNSNLYFPEICTHAACTEQLLSRHNVAKEVLESIENPQVKDRALELLSLGNQGLPGREVSATNNGVPLAPSK